MKIRNLAALIFSATLSVSIQSLSAATPNSVANDLENQRAKYERNMESLRADIQKKFLGELNAAAKDLEKAKSVGVEQDAFTADGKLPDVPAFQVFTNRYAVLAKNMNSAYATAITSYRKASNKPLADDVQADADHFAKNWDLLPWKDLIAQTGTIQKATAVSAASPLSLKLDETGEYRLEIRGKSTDMKSTASLTVPMPDGQPVTMPVVVSSRGDIHVFLSVYRDHISADTGVDRPVIPGKAVPVTSDKMLLLNDTAAAISSIRIKPIVDGSPPDLQAVVASARVPGAPAAQDPASLFPIGSQWAGTVKLEAKNLGTQSIAGSVVSVNAGEVRLKAKTNLGVVTYVLAISGNSVAVKAMLQPGNSFSHITVSGTVNDGQLSMSGGWVREGGGTGNGQQGIFQLNRQ